jgi:crotonobetaine/carnitine-CoA ligase
VSGRWFDEASVSVVGLLQSNAEAHPDRVFLDLDGSTYTYGEVWRRSTELAGALASLGVERGETVVSMQDTHIDAVASWFGTNMLGSVWVGINTALKGDFLRHVVNDTCARVVITEDEFLPRFAAVDQELPDVAHLLRRGSPAGHASPTNAQVARPVGLLADHRSPYAGPIHVAGADELTCLTYTGGTTGPSKGCMISNGYALNIGRKGLLQTLRQADELTWSPLPMFHLNVLAMSVVGSMLVGGTAALAPRFSVSRFWPEIERTGARVVNLIGGLPAMLASQPDTPEMLRCRGQIRMVHSVPFPPDLQAVWRDRFGVQIAGAKGYGMTEVFPITYQAAGEDAPPGSSGVSSEDFEVRIVDADDAEVAAGEVGEVVCRPRRPNVMFNGYWNRPDATLGSLRNLWFHTGDLGRIDTEGFFWFEDRKHDYLRRRGENISSQELEASFLAHPAIEQVAVHAVPSPLTEDDVKVTAVLSKGAQLSPEELFEWSKDRVPYFALPRYIEFRSALPLSPLGRVHKFQLRDEGCTPATWDRETAGVTWARR